jgi:outer membrane biosynthesis protein TonB
MRAGLPVSVLLHLGLVATGFAIAPAMVSQPSEMVILPVELLEIAETTNVVPIEAAEPDAEVAEETEAPAPEESAAPAPEPEAAPEEAAEIIPDPVKKPEPKKVETPAPPKAQPKKEEDFSDALSGILQTVEKKRTTATGSRSTTSASEADAAPRKGAGDHQRMTITVADFIRDQLQRRGCWADQEDMADAKRLRATIRIRFDRDGRLLDEPQLISPAREPAGDQPMQIFVQRARRALSMCSPFTVPREYYEVNPPQYIDIEFLP